MIPNAAAIDGTEDIPFSSDPGFSVSGRIERIEPARCGDMRLTLSFSRLGSRELTPDESHNAAFIIVPAHLHQAARRFLVPHATVSIKGTFRTECKSGIAATQLVAQAISEDATAHLSK